jgi:hypothetical protein
MDAVAIGRALEHAEGDWSEVGSLALNARLSYRGAVIWLWFEL